MSIRVAVQLLHPDAEVPMYMSNHASGVDFYACLPDGKIVIPKGKHAIIPTGIAMEIPSSLELQIRPRSGLAAKQRVTVLNTPGTIDADYRGEIKIILYNAGDDDFVVSHHDRIAQGVFAPVIRVYFTEQAQLDATMRGTGGFGSTGIHA